MPIDPNKTFDYKTLTETDLFSLLTEWRDAYYNSAPVVTDALFDQAEDFARTKFPNNPFFAKVGAAPVGGAWPKVNHSIPMGSLNKAVATKDAQGLVLASTELASWYASCGLPLGTWLTVMDKLDGSSLHLIYKKRHLVQAITRGDGTAGEEITRNALLMQGAIKMLPPSMPDTVSVRGEIIVKHDDFAKHFPGESNPRNTANGCAKRQTNHEK
jgi:DNA ligase (NAD+)